jgi:hypothetical protein
MRKYIYMINIQILAGNEVEMFVFPVDFFLIRSLFSEKYNYDYMVIE